MNHLLTVLPFHNGDVELTKRLLTWINELHGTSTPVIASILLAADSAVPIEQCKEIKSLAQKTFMYVDTTTVRVAAKDWRAPNEMFNACSKFVKETYKFPFLWLEADCVPLYGSWLAELTDAYGFSPRKYLGALVESKDESLPALHMTGCGIYPVDAIDLLDKHSNDKAESAWDISSAGDVVGRKKAANTGLIQSLWGQKDLPPTFVRQKEQGKEYPVNTLDVSFLREGAVLFHRVKDGSLIQVLRELRNEMLAAREKNTPQPLADQGLSQLPLVADGIKGEEPKKKTGK